MARFKTFANSGSFTPQDVNTLTTEIDTAMSSWRTIASKIGTPQGGNLSADLLYLLGATSSKTATQVGGYWQTTGTTDTFDTIFSIDQQQYGDNRTGALRAILMMSLNGVSGPQAVFNFGIYGMARMSSTTHAGSGILLPQFSTAPLPGTGFSTALPPANSSQIIVSGETPLPATGSYAVGFRVSAPAFSGSVLGMRVDIQARAVK